MKSFLIPLVFMAPCLVMAAPPSERDCKYSFAPESVQINWTAYKTTAHLPVIGQFKEFTINPTSAENLEEILKTTSVDLNILSSNTGKTSRDSNLLESFFKKLIGSVHAQIKDVVMDPANARGGSFNLDLSLNSVSRQIPMVFVIGDDSTFKASGSLVMTDFALEAALASLDVTCHDYHAGGDGISKVWPSVDIAISIPLKINCLN